MDPKDALLTLDTDDYRLLSPGFCKRYFPSDKYTSPLVNFQGTSPWPGMKLVTLDHTYEPDPDEMALDQWEMTSTDSLHILTGVRGALGSSGITLFQSNPLAGGITLTSTFIPEDNQPFYVDFYLQAVYNKLWYTDLQFCRNFYIRFLYNGSIQLWQNKAEPDSPDNWQFLKSVKGYSKIFNKHVKIAIYPTNHQELWIHLGEAEPFVIKVDDPLINVDEGGNVQRVICQRSPVKLTVWGGSFYFSYRFLRFKTTGYFILPLASLSVPFTGTVDLLGQLSMGRLGYTPTVTVTLVDARGAEITQPVSDLTDFAIKLEVTTDNDLFSPEINWVQAQVDPTCYLYPGANYVITEPGRVLEMEASNEAYSSKESKTTLSNMDMSFSALINILQMKAAIRTADQSITYWKGYYRKQSHTFGQGGDIRAGLQGCDCLIRLDVPLSDSIIGDGLYDTDYVEYLFKRAGLNSTDYYVDTTDPILLPEALGEEPPLFQSRDGKTIREMVNYLGKTFTGKKLYVNFTGTIVYGAIDYTLSPVATLVGFEPVAEGQLKMYDYSIETDSTNFFNVIVVCGQSMGGTSLMSYYYNNASITDRTYVDWLGFEKNLIYVDSNLITQELCNTALELIIAENSHPLQEVECTTAWQDYIDSGCIVAITNSPWRWVVTNLTRNWTGDMNLKLKLRNTWIPLS